MSKPLIEPRILKGFRDSQPDVMVPRQAMIRRLETVFSSFGYLPIDTPALEYADILLGKGSQETDKQLYRFQDGGERDVAMRFDLTVPLARFAAMYMGQLGAPFKRFHIAPVWRAEKPQRGRYREFIQCDFDILGTRSVMADAEILAIVFQSLAALGISHRIRFSNRTLLSALLDSLSIKEKTVPILRAIDKLDKIGEEAVAAELSGEGLTPDAIAKVFNFLRVAGAHPTREAVLRELAQIFEGDEAGTKATADVTQLHEALLGFGLTDSICVLDLSIARGLEYYTGTVFETEFVEMPQIGSICSGGRYDNLAGLYTKQDIPGVGGSIGLDRILGALEELGRLDAKAGAADVLVTFLDQQTAGPVAKLAQDIRDAGVRVELFPDTAKLGNQLKYADRRGIKRVVIAGPQEFAAQTVQIKDMTSGEQQSVPLAEAGPRLQAIISG